MRTPLSASLLALLLAPALADAHPYYAHHPHVRARPGVTVVVSPWVVGYHPTARPGWVWVEGHYAPDGVWIPGYWAPAAPRAGYVWVPGHWEADVYVEGEWRPAARPGYEWVEGRYDRGRWIPGYWQAVAPPPPEPPPPPPPPPDEPVHHDYEP